MRTSLRGRRPLEIATATVLAVFAFLSTFFSVSDRLGGAPVGYLVSILLALVVFFLAVFIASRRATKSIERRPPAGPDEDEAGLVATPPEEPGEEPIFEDLVDITPGRAGCWDYEIPLDVGDNLVGSLRETDGQTFNWMIMTQGNFLAWVNGDDPDYVEGEQDVRVAAIDRKVPRKGRWFLVIDAIQKQYPRRVSVHLRQVWKSP
jgi:hypothetical protein